ncbi:MAG: c-type cytochrome biogenesis protein CcsB [Thermosulfidibacteraceae bacterium]|jgi:cytochrome c-type biogenesis protein CcsB
MEVFLVYTLILLYLVSTVFYILFIFRNELPYARVGRYSMFGAVILQAILLILRFKNLEYFPLASMFDSTTFFTMVVAIIYLLIEVKTRIFVLGAFAAILGLIFSLFSTTFYREVDVIPPILRSYWFPIHAVTSFIGEGAFAISFILSLAYLIQERELRAKRFSLLLRRLPPITKLDELNYSVLKIGFLFLTVGIITGSIWASYAWGSFWSWDPKETWSLITWFVYAAILHARMTAGWRGKRAAMLSIVGFLSVLFLFFGVNLLLPGLHTYAR